MAKNSITQLPKIQMKKIITFCALILFFANGLRAQKYSREISTDSLLRMFRKESPFKVFNVFRSQYFSDYKGAYFNPELKTYLLKWLSKEENWKFEIEESIAEFSTNSEFVKHLIRHKLLLKHHEAWLDSITRTPALYEKYRDSVIFEHSNSIRENTKLETSYPPDYVISFHSKVAYPESYIIIKQWWVERGRPIWNVNHTSYDGYLVALVKMRDPEAMQLADLEIAKFVRSNGKSEYPITVLNFIEENQNPYGIEKLLETLSVTIKFPYISDGTIGQFNCMTIDILEEQLYLNSIPINAPIKRTSTCEEWLKHVKAFKDAAQILIKKYQENEKYWMDNMPYRKK